MSGGVGLFGTSRLLCFILVIAVIFVLLCPIGSIGGFGRGIC